MIEVIDKYKPVDYEGDADRSHFFKLGKEHFETNNKVEFDFINSLKDSIKIISFDIPEEFKEIFIPRANAPVYWIYDSWLLNQIDEYLKINFLRAKNIDIYKSIKENYVKWVTTKLKNEKEYYATSTINFIERDIYKHNFFKYIIQGIILLFHSKLYNFSKVLTLFNTAKELVQASRLSENAKQELLYLLTLYIGFAQLKESEYESANISFKEALAIKETGITAKFYCALTESNLGNSESTVLYLNDVLMFDFSRLLMAIKMNNFEMFNFFLKANFFQNIFYENDFCRNSSQIEKMINDRCHSAENEILKVQKKVVELKTKNIREYVNEEISANISLLEKLSQSYSESKHALVVGMYPHFSEFFNNIINQIISKLKEKLENEIKEKLSHIEKLIIENQNSEKHTLNEIEYFKNKSKDTLVKTLQGITENYDYQIKSLEDKIDNIPYLEKYNPQRSFSINMSNNFIVAFIVMIIGSFADNSSSAFSDSSGLNGFFASLVTSGIKWGIISFILGTLISLIISGFVLIEKADAKQKLTRKINSYRSQKATALSDAKEYSEHREKVTLENYNNSLIQYRKNIKEVTEHRDTEKDKLNLDASEKLRAFEELLASLIS
ncbi:MAG: hypothetical protein RDU14_10045 [Melioribacteraceae bacterium]|nr:hypothetical protein [Melioribacteraceae bacterium]